MLEYSWLLLVLGRKKGPKPQLSIALVRLVFLALLFSIFLILFVAIVVGIQRIRTVVVGIAGSFVFTHND